MRAVHLQTLGVTDENEAALVEMVVRLTDGVFDVAAIRSLDLVSVLYDEHETDLRDIVGAVRSAGFDASAYGTASAFARV